MPLRKFVHPLLTAVLLLAPFGTMHASGSSAKGMATITYERKLTPEHRQDAAKKARLNAIERHFSEQGQAKLKNFEIVRESILNEIDSYLLGTSILSEEDDSAAKTYRLVIRADLNIPRLENRLQSGSAVQNTATAEKSLLTFLFVARQQAEVKTYQDKVVSRTDTENIMTHQLNADGTLLHNENAETRTRTREAESVDKSTVTMNDRNQTKSRNREESQIEANVVASEKSSSSTITGGSSTQKSDEVKWKVARASDINSVVTGVFSTAGYEVVEGEMIDGLDVESITADFGAGDDLKPATLRTAAKSIQAAEIPFFALGTLDVGMRDQDPVSGLTRVHVSVSGKVLDLRGKFPKTVSSVGPVLFAGLGPNADVARVNALKLAAENAGQQLLNELNAKGVR